MKAHHTVRSPQFLAAGFSQYAIGSYTHAYLSSEILSQFVFLHMKTSYAIDASP